MALNPQGHGGGAGWVVPWIALGRTTRVSRHADALPPGGGRKCQHQRNKQRRGGGLCRWRGYPHRGDVLEELSAPSLQRTPGHAAIR